MVRRVVLVLLVGCGRFGFGPQENADAGSVTDAPDGPMLLVDVAPLDAMLPSGLVSWFPLDDGSAQTFADVVSGFGGTCSGTTCPIQTAGHHGMAFLFDGTDDCIRVPNMGQFGQAQITLSVWIRQDIVDACSPIAKPADSVSSTADTWQIETTTSQEVTFTSTHGTSSNTRLIAGSGTLVIGQWQHVAATFDGTRKKIFVDGVEVGDDGSITTPLTYDVQPMWIGCDNNGGAPAMRFNGSIDEVQLYNRALSRSEIQMLAAM